MVLNEYFPNRSNTDIFVYNMCVCVSHTHTHTRAPVPPDIVIFRDQPIWQASNERSNDNRWNIIRDCNFYCLFPTRPCHLSRRCMKDRERKQKIKRVNRQMRGRTWLLSLCLLYHTLFRLRNHFAFSFLPLNERRWLVINWLSCQALDRLLNHWY